MSRWLIVLACGLLIGMSVAGGHVQQKRSAKSPDVSVPDASQVAVYKTIGDVKLNIYLFTPAGHKRTDRRPAIVFFFGGGWKKGTPKQFAPHCKYLASRGMVAMTADYRVLERHGVKAVKCLADAKSAMRWVRRNADKLGIDAKRIAAGGGSAGGHLAAALATIDGFNEPDEDTSVTARPDALLLFNPALDLTYAGFEVDSRNERISDVHKRLGTSPKALSPTFHVKKGMPPTIIFHGKTDITVPYSQAVRFRDAMLKMGNRCELDGHADEKHGFFNYGRNGNKAFVATLKRADQFLASLGYLSGKPTIEADVTKSVSISRMVQFNRDIRPILSDNCFTCHGPDPGQREADLRLDTQRGLYGKTESGAAPLVAGDLKASLLYHRITSSDSDKRMPPPDSGKKLSGQQIATIRQWIQQGAPWQDHWSLIPPKRSSPPQVRNKKWISNTIDRFILSRLEIEKLTPSPAADRRTLARRLSFDLTGLPPDVDDVDAFVENPSDQAYEKLVDRLLASAHYGERIAVHWLDLVRYADTVGYHGDQERQVSPYRDYVIHAFNSNLPFDQFTIEQLAGDLLPNATITQRVASGYNMLNMTTIEGGAQAKEYLAKYAADRVRNVSSVWMAATLGCAECHDHKFDRYTMKDFYSFESFFADVREKGVGNPPADLAVLNDTELVAIEKLNGEIAQLAGDQADEHKAQIAALNKRKAKVLAGSRKSLQTVSVTPRVIRVLKRGSWLDESGEIVTPHVSQFLRQLDVADRRANRLDLARWLVSRDHPQTARVFVNRLWKLFYGTGLSKVLDDLGTRGEWPLHAELLDWLAVEFIESGWDVKHVVKLMVISSTYRQSSLAGAALRERDPFNRLLARQSRFRIEAEMVRDNTLAISGLLVRTIGGNAAKPYQPAGYYAHLNFPKRTYVADTGKQQYRRGVYTHWQRTFLHPMLLAFDAPTREECAAERPISNTPLAALALLNDPSHVEAARVFAARIASEGGSTPVARATWAFRQTLSRPPIAEELQIVVTLYNKHLQHYSSNEAAAKGMLTIGLTPVPNDAKPAELAAWTSVARTLFNLNETITRN